MCGIIGYKGHRNKSVKIIVDGLKILEYRGYDSWGIGYIGRDKKIGTPIKKVGAIGEVHDTSLYAIQSHTVIGHTRWATTGRVSLINTHPHLSHHKHIAVVHNGIVENYQELKKMLKAKGKRFVSETDTEVIANLIEYEWEKETARKKHRSFADAVSLAFHEIAGRNAILAFCDDTGELVAARNGSPLIIGVGKGGEYFVASDIPAFLAYTNRVIYLDDGQMAVISDKKLSKTHEATIAFFDIKAMKKINRRIVTVDLKPETVDKGNFKHFMIKEIMEQKETIRKAVSQNDAEIKKIASMIMNAFGTFSVACGTAGYASQVGQYLFSALAKKHINFVIASEFLSHVPFLTSKTLMLVTSQSGETADVIEAIEAAKRKGVKIVALVNVQSSTIAKKSDYCFYINAGPEKAVASTKAATSQIALHTLLAFAAAGKLHEGKRMLVNAAAAVNDMLNPRYEAHIQKLAQKLKKTEDMYVIGRGVMYPVALEIALKIKEVSYIHADGLPGGELKHGTLALIEPKTPCIVAVGENGDKESILSNAQEVKARGGYIIGIAPKNDPVFDYFIRVPDVGVSAPIVSIIPGQILAYHLAVLRGCDPDKPRNLAKSVTVK